jgi:hypothetical protein
MITYRRWVSYLSALGLLSGTDSRGDSHDHSRSRQRFAQETGVLTGVASGHPFPPHDIPNRPDILKSASTSARHARTRWRGYSPATSTSPGFMATTSQAILQIEAAGFAKREGGPFVENGRIELGGALPVNTHGGLLSQAHNTA